MSDFDLPMALRGQRPANNRAEDDRMAQRVALFGVTAAAVLGASAGLLSLMIWLVPQRAQMIVGPAVLCASCLAATAIIWLGFRQPDRWRGRVAFALVAMPVVAVLTPPAVVLALGFYLVIFTAVFPVLAVTSLALGVICAAFLVFGRLIGKGRVAAAVGLSALGLVWYVYASLPQPMINFEPIDSFTFRLNLAFCFAVAVVAATTLGAWAAWAYRPAAVEPTIPTPAP